MRPFVDPSRGTRAGFSMLEVLISVVVLLVALMSLMSSVVTSEDLQNQSRTTSLAAREINRVHESFRNGDVDGLFDLYTAAPTFAAGQLTVEVTFPEQLLVDQLGAAVPVGWRFRDLDADGAVDRDASATETASLLPVQVRVTAGESEHQARFLVTER